MLIHKTSQALSGNLLKTFQKRPDLSALMSHQFLVKVGTGLFGAFVPIFLYEAFHFQLLPYFLFSIAFHFGVFALQPLCSRALNAIGWRSGIVLGMILYAVSYLVLMIRVPSTLPLVLSVMFITCMGYQMFYWVPYHLEITSTTSDKNRGRILALLASGMALIGVFTPMLGGYAVQNFGYNSIMWISALFFLLSIIPIRWLRPIKERFTYTYTQTYRVLFAKENRDFLSIYVVQGAEHIVGSMIWPIFLFQLFQGNYLYVGINAGILVAITIILELIAGYLTDTHSKKRLITIGTGGASFGWIMKALASTAPQAVFAGIFHSFALIFLRLPFESVTYSRLKQAGHFIDEYTTLRDLALSLGRALMLIACFLCISFFGFSAGFFITAIVSLGFAYANRLIPTPKLKA